MAGTTGSIESLRTSVADRWTRARSLMALIACSRSVRRVLLGRLIATILCVCIGVWATRTLSEAAELRDSWGPRTTVLVARHDLQPGEVLTRSDVDEETLPSALTPPGAVTDLSAGARVTAPVLAGEPLVGGRIGGDAEPLAPEGSTAIRLDLAVSAPELARGDLVDVLGPRGNLRAAEPGLSPRDRNIAQSQVGVISRGSVVLRPPTAEDPTVEVSVDEGDLPSVAEAAFGGGVAVVRRSP